MEGLAMAGAGAPLAGPDDLVQCTHVGLRRIPRIARIARNVTERADIGRRASAVLVRAWGARPGPRRTTPRNTRGSPRRSWTVKHRASSRRERP